MPKRKPESQRRPPVAKVLEEFGLERDPWKELRNRPGIKIVSTAGRESW